MTLVEKICEELGVEVDEVWNGNDGGKYKINEGGVLIDMDHKNPFDGISYHQVDNISRVLSGALEPIWQPKLGDVYYIPCIEFNNNERYTEVCWEDSVIDRWYHYKGMVFRTKNGAINCTGGMINSIKEELI